MHSHTYTCTCMHSHKYSYARIHIWTHRNTCTQLGGIGAQGLPSALPPWTPEAGCHPSHPSWCPWYPAQCTEQGWVSSLLQWEEQGCSTFPSLQGGMGNLDTLFKWRLFPPISSLLAHFLLLEDPGHPPAEGPLLWPFPRLSGLFLQISWERISLKSFLKCYCFNIACHDYSV